jgi:anionic cell wall polymer biosynthesis LytR-Cps2A-Psr (LCP) family protein
MNDLEDRLRLLMDDVTTQAPPAPQRSAQLHQRIMARRRVRAAGIAGLAAVAVVAVVGASAGLVSLRAPRGLAPAAQSTTPAGTLAGGNVAVHPSPSGPKNILLVRVGVAVGDPTTDTPDSIMILHISSGFDRGYLTSIPPEAYVAIPAYDNGRQRYGGGKDRIEAAYTLGARGLTGAEARRHGFELLSRTLANLSGLTFDAAAITDDAGLTKVVDAIGGVNMKVDEKTASVDVGFDDKGRQTAPYHLNSDGTVGYKLPGVTAEVYEVGEQHFAAWQAVDYTRQRDLLTGGDFEYGRERHQQQLVQAIYRTLKSSEMTDPKKLSDFLNTLGQAATIDTGAFGLRDWSLALLRGLDPTQLVSIAMNGGQFDSAKIGGEYVELLSDTSMQLLHGLRDDTVTNFIASHPGWVTIGG